MAKGYSPMKRGGSTAKSHSYRGNAGGFKGVRIGGGTTYRPGAKSRIMSGNNGTQTGGKFAQKGHPMKTSTKTYDGRKG